MSFVGLYTGLSGVRAAQTGIDLASHNVANSATPGYTRQRMELTPGAPYDSPVGPLGTGVTVAQIGRLRDTFLDTRARTGLADHGESSVRANLLTSLEALTSEPDDGISTRLTALWTAAEAWANDPADPATRRQVISELGAVSETFRAVSSQWDALEADVALDRTTRITAVNEALASLAELDSKIANSPPNRVGTELFDQRDVLLDDLAELTGATARVGADGRSEVLLAGVDLVGIDAHARLELDAAGAVQVVGHDGAVTATAGQLGGIVGGQTRFLTQDLPQWRGQLDALAAGLATSVNQVNGQGATATGAAGQALLGYDPADPAGSLGVLTDDLAALAAGPRTNPATPPGPHDNTNAQRLSQLRTAEVTIGGTTTKLDTHFSNLVTGLAGDVRSARTSASAARAVASSAASARDAEHGVSLDEEMVELVRYQRALEASARVMTTIDQALDTLVNRVGIVGR